MAKAGTTVVTSTSRISRSSSLRPAIAIALRRANSAELPRQMAIFLPRRSSRLSMPLSLWTTRLSLREASTSLTKALTGMPWAMAIAAGGAPM